MLSRCEVELILQTEIPLQYPFGVHRMPPKRSRTLDCGADYNALGRDPNGFMTWVVAFFYGTWLPTTPAHRFGGPPQPPRYGPPASYQLACLPEGFKPNPPPRFHSYDPTSRSMDEDEFLEPPEKWTPELFAALRHTATFEDKGGNCILVRFRFRN